jgi:transcriptional/translational regulatory protein YebC/TACO1
LPESNTRLAVALKKAKELNFPKDRLENTFAKADKSGETLTAVTYEALGPPSAQGGAAVALVIECSTDSPGRTHAKVKEIFNKSASSNYRLSSVGHLFQKRGVIRLALASGEASKFDEVFEVALENGAEEVSEVEAENEAQGKIVQEGGTIVEVRDAGRWSSEIQVKRKY